MEKTALLTIAVPTYNRSALLKETLNSIFQQVDSRFVRVLVVDNCSSDNTSDIVSEYNVDYIRNSKNMGIDFNINSCIQNSKTKYVQVLSDDDLLVDGSISILLDNLKGDPSFVFLNGFVFTDKPILRDNNRIFNIDEDFSFKDKNNFVETLWIWSTFVSSFVVKKELWPNEESISKYIGTDILLSYGLFDLLSRGDKFNIISKSVIAARASYTGNYNILYAFSYQWHKLLMEYAPEKGFDVEVMEKIFLKSAKLDILPRLISISLRTEINKDSKEYGYLFNPLREYRLLCLCFYIVLKSPKFFKRILLKSFYLLNINNINNKISIYEN